MKKLTFLICFLAFLGGLQAQDNKKTDHKIKDYVIMKDGKMMVIKDGKTTAMDKEIALPDGTRIMSDGKVMMNDGSTKILKDGESMPLSSSNKTKKEPAQ